MEDALRKELTDLCREIIDQSENGALEDQLKQLQLLEEKMILLKYLRFRQEEIGNRSQPPIQQSPISKKLDEELEQTLQNATSQQQSPPPMERPISPEPSISEAIEPEAEDIAPTSASPAQEEPTADPEIKKEPEPRPSLVSEAPVAPKKLAADQPPRQPSSSTRNAQRTPITLGLNDRISFTSKLFDGSQEDLNRVISQLNTFDNYGEAERFIREMVKPDYNWSDKPEYEERLIDLVKARFGES